MILRLRPITIAVATALCGLSLAGAQDAAGPPAETPAKDPETVIKEGSYAIGTQFAGQFGEGDLNLDEFVRGFKDQTGGGELAMSQTELQTAMRDIQMILRERQQTRQQAAGAENLAEAEAFLAKNKERPEVTTTESGLQYEVITEGKGNKPRKTDKVVAHYHGTLTDGTVFDSSVERGEPLEIPVSGVIQGWQEALTLMPVGSKYRLYIPPALAYGPRGQGAIGPNEALIFDIELLEIKAVTSDPVPIPPRPTKEN